MATLVRWMLCVAWAVGVAWLWQLGLLGWAVALSLGLGVPVLVLAFRPARRRKGELQYVQMAKAPVALQ